MSALPASLTDACSTMTHSIKTPTLLSSVGLQCVTHLIQGFLYRVVLTAKYQIYVRISDQDLL